MVNVLVIGCGIVGPAISLLLKKKGYNPVIVEKVKQHGDAGLNLGMFPNGLKVLSLLGLAQPTAPWREGAEYTSDGELLGTWDQSYFSEEYGFPSFAIRRSELQQRLRDEASRQGILIHQGWELVELRETTDDITAFAKDGRQISASFAIGCDGLHSMTRKHVLHEHGLSEVTADSTGLVMIGGFCPKPQTVPSDRATAWYGVAKYALSFAVDEKTSVWAIVLPAPDEQENWQQEINLTEERDKLLDELQGWPEVLLNAVTNTDRIVKFGLYDRPEIPPEHWFYGRCVLVGDAAHPTSPHYGQGANQSLEDCWHLSQLLPEADGDLSTVRLNEIFLQYAGKRQPRTAMMVKGARAQGQMRVTFGEEACRKRNEIVKKVWSDTASIKARFHQIFKEPF